MTARPLVHYHDDECSTELGWGDGLYPCGARMLGVTRSTEDYSEVNCEACRREVSRRDDELWAVVAGGRMR